jgi:cell pole-organizing protein PopZ
MEDILASIRRILNEEEAPAEAAAPTDAPADDDILVLDQSMMVSTGEHSRDAIETEPELEPPVPKIEPPAAHVDPPAIEPEPSFKEIAAAASNQPHPMEAPTKLSDLMAPETAAAATSLVGNLVRSLSAGRATQVYSGGPTLEDLVRAELRPLLKEWLDTNLPPIVERLVRTEIERVVGRAIP